MTTDRERDLEAALVQFLQPIRNIPFDVVIRALCGVSVIPFDPEARVPHDHFLRIVTAMRAAGRTVQMTPIIRPRPNEVGNDMEAPVIAGLRDQGLAAAPPTTRTGAGRSTGYPDIRIEGQPPIYLEVKTYAAGQPATTMRSFYVSPSEQPKVWEDAHHLLVGFEMVREENRYWPVGFTIVDLFGLPCDMKAEFNSDNRRLYETGRVLAKVRLDPEGGAP